jgi:hypothetical protein
MGGLAMNARQSAKEQKRKAKPRERLVAMFMFAPKSLDDISGRSLRPLLAPSAERQCWDTLHF